MWYDCLSEPDITAVRGYLSCFSRCSAIDSRLACLLGNLILVNSLALMLRKWRGVVVVVVVQSFVTRETSERDRGSLLASWTKELSFFETSFPFLNFRLVVGRQVTWQDGSGVSGDLGSMRLTAAIN